MFEKAKDRYLFFIVLFVAMFAVLIFQLFNLTVINGDTYSEKAKTTKTRTITLKGNRGTIYDSNGIALAYDEVSYDVKFYKDPTRTASSDRANYTDIIIRTIDIIESNGGETIDTFNIVKNSAGEFVFEFGITNIQHIAKREANWRTNMYISTTSTPEQIYYSLRERYRIPESMPYEEARKVLSIWQEVQLSTWISYIPVTIATDVDANTVAQIEALGNELTGMQISKSTVRVYPRSSLAAHAIGYMGQITDEATLQKYSDKGYSTTDAIGLSGIEATMEDELTGNSKDRQGSRKIELNTSGEILSELEYIAPSNGNNVHLTLDSQMQSVLEKALESNIKRTNAKQQQMFIQNNEKYVKVIGDREPNLAVSGAAVVMEAKTGNVRAIASYPSYDLNLFTGGIDDESYKALLDDKAAPLFNKSISSRAIPGSIFKMVTGMAGLMEGEITLSTKITDAGYFDKYVKGHTHGPKCWIYPNIGSHADLTLISAIRVSCNYYFFEVADRLGIAKINEWAENFGLTSKTGIQLTGEVTGQIGSQETLYDSTKTVAEQKTAVPLLVYNKIVEDLHSFGDIRGIEYSDSDVTAAAERILKLAGNGVAEKGPQIREILSEELDIHESTARTNGWDLTISSRLTELEWTGTNTANVGIGQGATGTMLTPIAVARYISSLMNGGVVYQANIIDKITDSNGNVVSETTPTVANKLELPQSYLDAIKEGMREVVSGEDRMSVAEAFKDMPKEYVAQIGGKTGTGQVTTNFELENNAWFVSFAPYDDPEIVVVVFIPNGYAGSEAMWTAADVLEYYFDQKNAESKTDIPSEGTLIN